MVPVLHTYLIALPVAWYVGSFHRQKDHNEYLHVKLEGQQLRFSLEV